LRSSREFLARSWNSAHNFLDENPDKSKFPIESYHGLDEATAKRIKQFEDETKSMMTKQFEDEAPATAATTTKTFKNDESFDDNPRRSSKGK
jgi:hypothetical protein